MPAALPNLGILQYSCGSTLCIRCLFANFPARLMYQIRLKSVRFLTPGKCAGAAASPNGSKIAPTPAKEVRVYEIDYPDSLL